MSFTYNFTNVDADTIKNDTFCQIPLSLNCSKYQKLSLEAVNAYGYFQNKARLSLINHKYDQNGNLYFFYPNDELAKVLRCSVKTAIKAKKELEDFGLLKQVRGGYNTATDTFSANQLYLGVINPEIKHPQKSLKQTVVKKANNSTIVNSTISSQNYNPTIPSTVKVKRVEKLDNSIIVNFTNNKINKPLRDTKEIQRVTEPDFSSKSLTAEQTKAIDQDAIAHYAEYMTEVDTHGHNFMNKAGYQLLKLWCKSVAEMQEVQRKILVAKRSVVKELVQKGYDKFEVNNALYIAGNDTSRMDPADYEAGTYARELAESPLNPWKLQDDITHTLRHVLNSIRQKYDDPKQRSVKNQGGYLYKSFVDLFKTRFNAYLAQKSVEKMAETNCALA